MPQIGRVYFVSYVEHDTSTLYEFYCTPNVLIDDTVYFTVNSWVRGNENNKYDEGIQLGWQISEWHLAYLNEMGKEDLVEISRCAKCGRKTDFIVRAALSCPVHGVVGGF